MAFDFDKKTTRKDAVIRLLILAFLSLTLFPHHYHYHHVADPSVQDLDGHVHASDVHAHLAFDAIDHGDEGHVIKSVADVPLKGQNAKPGWVMALMVFLLCLPFVAQAAGVHPRPSRFRLPRFDRRIIPPLRAPPAV